MGSLSDMIVMMQMGIFIIMAIMIGMVALYIFLMSSRKNSKVEFKVEVFGKDKMEYSDKNMYDYSEESQYDSINSEHEDNDNDPIKNL